MNLSTAFHGFDDQRVKCETVGGMEPMRPVEVTEAPVDARVTRRRIWWTIVLAITLSVQVVFVVGYGVSYWWAVAFGGLMWAFYEGFFWLADRRRS